MAKAGKKYQDAVKLIEADKVYAASEAMELVKKTATAKFDETIELHVRLGVDPKYADQQVRGAVVLPHGTGKTKRVLVFAKGDKVLRWPAGSSTWRCCVRMRRKSFWTPGRRSGCSAGW